jgi:hypothetical protein
MLQVGWALLEQMMLEQMVLEQMMLEQMMRRLWGWG